MGIEMKITFVSYIFFFQQTIYCVFTQCLPLYFLFQELCVWYSLFYFISPHFLEFRCDGNSQNYTVDHLHAELHAGSRKCPELNLRNLDWFPVKK